MSFMTKLHRAWDRNNSLVCVGLDPDLDKLPECVRHEPKPIFAFNRALIDATRDLVCCYKPQIAYYAAFGAEDELAMTIDYLSQTCPDIPVILDAKRGDIGSTAAMYAREAFVRYGADAVTVNPYMGTDNLKSFLDYSERGVVILCRTSNPSSAELQELVAGDRQIYQYVAEYAATRWNYNHNVMLVVGATFPEELGRIRQQCPEIPFLVPGIGAQGGDVAKVLENGQTADGKGLVINSSRGIIYAGKGPDFAAAARRAATALRDEINRHRREATR
ncbi:MAG: orotidine-5'-phosphate decarboxylase [Victivallales bacterium]|nr:orotidine-5'-phosphate decarboxylase [Victivallales bacterium]